MKIFSLSYMCFFIIITLFTFCTPADGNKALSEKALNSEQGEVVEDTIVSPSIEGAKIKDTISFESIKVGSVSLLDTKDQLINNLGVPDSTGKVFNEIEEIFETVLYYESDKFFLVEDRLEYFIINSSKFPFGSNVKVKVGDNCAKLNHFSKNPCSGQEINGFENLSKKVSKTFLISFEGTLVDSYLIFTLDDSLISEIIIKS